MNLFEFNSVDDVSSTFPNEDACLVHLEHLKWPDGIITSPFDPVSRVYRCADGRYRCRNSGKYFNAKTGTIFYNTKVPLQKWFMAIWMVATAKTPITSVELADELHITQKTAWYLLRRIKNHLGLDATKIKSAFHAEAESLDVVVEQDKMKLLDWLKTLKK